jgi:hypothetical protein
MLSILDEYKLDTIKRESMMEEVQQSLEELILLK